MYVPHTCYRRTHIIRTEDMLISHTTPQSKNHEPWIATRAHTHMYLPHTYDLSSSYVPHRLFCQIWLSHTEYHRQILFTLHTTNILLPTYRRYVILRTTSIFLSTYHRHVNSYTHHVMYDILDVLVSHTNYYKHSILSHYVRQTFHYLRSIIIHLLLLNDHCLVTLFFWTMVLSQAHYYLGTTDIWFPTHITHFVKYDVV